MGNSVRGVEFAKKLVETFAFHHLDILRGVGHKIVRSNAYLLLYLLSVTGRRGVAQQVMFRAMLF